MKPKYAARVILPILLAMLAPALHAGSVNPAVIGLFPKNVGEFAYADLRQARQFPWFAQFQQQVLPTRFREFEHFLSSAGINPDTQVQEMVWAVLTPAATVAPDGTVQKTAPSADEIVGVALGQYSPDSTDEFFKSHKLATAQVHNYTMYAFGSGSGASDLFFVFIDSNTAAFGEKSMLEHMLNARDGLEENLNANETMAPLIAQANGQGVFWGVLNQAYTKFALQQLMPEASQFPAAGQLMSKVTALLISVQNFGSSQLQTDFNAVCATGEDASTLAQLLQAAVLLRRYQAGQSNPQLAQLLDAARIVPNGDKLDVSFSMTNDQIASLIRSNTFAMKQ
jgi:hypothetical protein